MMNNNNQEDTKPIMLEDVKGFEDVEGFEDVRFMMQPNADSQKHEKSSEDNSNNKTCGRTIQLTGRFLALTCQNVIQGLVIRQLMQNTNLYGALDNADASSKKYKNALYAFYASFGVSILVQVLLLSYSVRQLLVRRQRVWPFWQCVLISLTHMSSAVSEALLIKHGGHVIDWHTHAWSLLLQAAFVLATFVTLSIDVVHTCVSERKRLGSYCSPVLMVVGLVAAALYACLVYAPVSWAMVGWKGFALITVADFKNSGLRFADSGLRFADTSNEAAVADMRAEWLLVLLMNVGHVGQFIWFAVCILLLAVCCYKGCMYDGSNDKHH